MKGGGGRFLAYQRGAHDTSSRLQDRPAAGTPTGGHLVVDSGVGPRKRPMTPATLPIDVLGPDAPSAA